MLLSCATGSEQFLGSEAIASYATAKAVILPIPYEATTTYRKGCETGPAAVIAASQQLEAYDEELKRETCLEVGIYTHDAIADTRQQPQLSAEEMLAVTTATVSRLIADNKFVVAVGGEHAITTGVVQAYRQALSEPFTVVQIDAHGDMRFEYEGSYHNHACVMRRVLEMGLPTLPVGIRAICREEAELIAKQQIPVIWDRDIARDLDWIEKAIAKITTEKVFLTIDVDGIDPALIPGVGTPEPGGLSWHQTLGFLGRLFQTHQVIGCDVMELAPISDSVVSEFTTAKLIYKLIGYQFTAQGLA
ncbi:MAG: agmatinase [Microcystis aeruginosa W13-11]|nr:agmatinase [Microcystis aeruginosa W13-11]